MPDPQEQQSVVPAEPPRVQKCWVIFTPEGDPGWYGPSEVEGAEWVEDLPLNAPAMRRVDGAWVPRPPPPPPTEAEIAARDAQREADARMCAAEAEAERERVIAYRLGPDIALRAMGKITIADLERRELEIRADVEAGN